MFRFTIPKWCVRISGVQMEFYHHSLVMSLMPRFVASKFAKDELQAMVWTTLVTECLRQAPEAWAKDLAWLHECIAANESMQKWVNNALDADAAFGRLPPSVKGSLKFLPKRFGSFSPRLVDASRGHG